MKYLIGTLLSLALPLAANDGTSYYLYVAAESEDVVALARFDSATNEIEVL